VDQLIFFMNEVWTVYFVHFRNRSLIDWTLFFVPFYIFGEVPRYLIPAVTLMFSRILRLDQSDENEKQRFWATNPRISALLVGLNEKESIVNAIESLLEFEYPNLEIVVIDDHSTDGMYQAAKPYADRGVIKLFRNSGASGRSGRPVVSNFAFQMCSGDYILSIDADTSFDKDALYHMIGPFYDPEVGVVAGNLKPRNGYENLLTSMQSIEYLQSISIWKRWLNLLGWNMQASGAFGAFRRETLEACGGWDSELAEDADLSLKIKHSGWYVQFAPQAIAMTQVPDTLGILMRQRYRWDRGMLRTYFRKHAGLMNFTKFKWENAAEMSIEFVFSILLPYVYLVWVTYMAIFHLPILIFVWIIVYVLYLLTNILILTVALEYSERWRDEWHLLFSIFAFPLFKSFFRWVRLYAVSMELFRINYEDGYLPESAWRNTYKW
jgi:poly-beta-1,6-N-acetyl-D-glucosamine synthase